MALNAWWDSLDEEDRDLAMRCLGRFTSAAPLQRGLIDVGRIPVEEARYRRADEPIAQSGPFTLPEYVKDFLRAKQ